MTSSATAPTRNQIRAVVFDAFGTLVEITDVRRPFRQLMDNVCQSADSRKAFAHHVMTSEVDLETAIDRYSSSSSPRYLAQLHGDLRTELDSIRLFPEVAQVIATLREKGIKIGICSNLAAPYAGKVLELLPLQPDAISWSFKVGAVKPAPAVYAHICSLLELPPQQILMVGDRKAEDYEGPINYGMQALWLRRDSSLKCERCVSTLSEIALVSTSAPT